MPIQSRIAERLGLEHPIIQAPMAGGPTTVDLVEAVSEAGALGSFGFAITPPEQMRSEVAALRARTDRPFNLNLFTHPLPTAPDAARIEAALAALRPHYQALSAPLPERIAPPFMPDPEAQLEAVLDLRPALFSFHFHAPAPEVIARMRQAGIAVAGSVTTVAEARALVAAGADFVIAQGAEAGGHRASFLEDPATVGMGTLALVRAVAQAVDVPVIAAGGIMDGAGIAAALALGADAVQLGTAFLACPEAGTDPLHRRAVLEWAGRGTRVTRAFSGRPARALRNRFIDATTDAPVLPFPAQNQATRALRQAAMAAGDPEYLSLWAGEGVALARALPAAELIRALVAETEQAIAGLGARAQGN